MPTASAFIPLMPVLPEAGTVADVLDFEIFIL